MPFKRLFHMKTARTIRWLAACAAVIFAVCVAGQAIAGSPTLNNLLPLVGQRGQAVDVTFYGDRLKDSSHVLLHRAGIEAEPLANEDKRVQAVLRIADDAPLGEHQLRLVTRTGVTEMVSFHVVDHPVVREKRESERDQSTSFDEPQPIEPGTVVVGRTLREDVDYYGLQMKKGERMTVQVSGMRLGRGFTDSHLAVLDADGKTVAECDDTALLRQDPYVAWVAPRDGRYVVAIRDSGYAGGNNNWYLLHVGRFVRPAVVYPMGGRPGERVDARFMGDIEGDFTQTVELPAEADNGYRLVPTIDGERPPLGHRFRVNDLPNVFEDSAKANNSLNDMNQAAPHPAPVALNGLIEKPGDRDFFRITLRKNQTVEVRCFAGSMGSPLDPVINLFDFREGNRKHLQGNDDGAAGSDSELTFKAPADGDYVVRVRDHRGRGGPQFVYRVEVTEPKPALSTEINRYDRNRPQERQAIAVPQGNRVAALVRVDRQRVGGDLQPWAAGLVDGVAYRGPAPDGRGEMPVVFEAQGQAALGAGLVNLGAERASGGDGSAAIRGGFSQQTPLVMANPNRTEYYHTTLDRVPVAVTEAVPFAIRVAEPEAPLVRDGTMRLKVDIQRDAGYEQDVRLYMLWRPPGLGARGSVYVKKDRPEAAYEIDANGNMPTRRWPLVVIARANVRGEPVWVSSQLFEIDVQQPFVTGSIEKAACTRGESVELVVNLRHPRDWEGAGELKLHGLPPGCEVQPMQIKPGQEQAVFKVQTADKTPPGRHKSLLCELTIQVNGEPVVHRFGRGGQLRIDRPRKDTDQPETPQDDDNKAGK